MTDTLRYEGFTLKITTDLDRNCLVGEIVELVKVDQYKYNFTTDTVSNLKKKFEQLVDERIEELGADIFDTHKKFLSLPVVSIKGTEYVVDVESRYWLQWGRNCNKDVPKHLATAIESKLFKLGAYSISSYTTFDTKIIESIQQSELKATREVVNKVLRQLLEINPEMWIDFCIAIINTKGLAYLLSRDEKSKFETEDLFGDTYCAREEDVVPQKLLDILDTDFGNYMCANPLFYLY